MIAEFNEPWKKGADNSKDKKIIDLIIIIDIIIIMSMVQTYNIFTDFQCN